MIFGEGYQDVIQSPDNTHSRAAGRYDERAKTLEA